MERVLDKAWMVIFIYTFLFLHPIWKPNIKIACQAHVPPRGPHQKGQVELDSFSATLGEQESLLRSGGCEQGLHTNGLKFVTFQSQWHSPFERMSQMTFRDSILVGPDMIRYKPNFRT